MNSNSLNLKFAKDAKNLAGYEYGEHEFNEQVKDKINYNETFTLVFPPQIEKIASSFVQGFFAKIKEKIGLQGIEERLTLKTKSDALKNSIMQNLR